MFSAILNFLGSQISQRKYLAAYFDALRRGDVETLREQAETNPRFFSKSPRSRAVARVLDAALVDDSDDF